MQGLLCIKFENRPNSATVQELLAALKSKVFCQYFSTGEEPYCILNGHQSLLSAMSGGTGTQEKMSTALKHL